MADSKPSITSSTLTMLAVWSVVWFTLAAAYVGVRLAQGMEDKIAALILAPFATLLSGFGMSYLAVRKSGNLGGANGQVETVVPPAVP